MAGGSDAAREPTDRVRLVRLLLVTYWHKTADGRWYCSSTTEYYLPKPRVERHILLHRNPEMLEQLEREGLR